eukprot:CAMPEP_0181204830 /NCGR_PEP_ID=MMETSP1096-20121128/20146_1 /TAXON_ID=156174 ORGANISM="Chrysochromulina ericina, Strain CCMP281" /NCGR_SAMPLE_ID=MMETSP1096 /ASSEMBLY_ACC=CAM_ASM_000453 /LENGTH=61 /DNA_ID=CAMNT_0023295559 /DNA_START=712 /DNA_END=897 /DNA_ORIENTATION=+
MILVTLTRKFDQSTLMLDLLPQRLITAPFNQFCWQRPAPPGGSCSDTFIICSCHLGKSLHA